MIKILLTLGIIGVGSLTALTLMETANFERDTFLAICMNEGNYSLEQCQCMKSLVDTSKLPVEEALIQLKAEVLECTK